MSTKKPARKKEKMVSMRMTKDQFEYLERMIARIKKRTGFKVTRASIIVKLMEYGLPHLEDEFPEVKKDGEARDHDSNGLDQESEEATSNVSNWL